MSSVTAPFALARYRTEQGVRLGVVVGDRIRALSADDLGAVSLNEFLAAPDWAAPRRPHRPR